jgi:hypothetical protein
MAAWCVSWRRSAGGSGSGGGGPDDFKEGGRCGDERKRFAKGDPAVIGCRQAGAGNAGTETLSAFHHGSFDYGITIPLSAPYTTNRRLWPKRLQTRTT